MKRRTFLLGVSAGAASMAWPTGAQVQGRTPGQILGPYYPVARPAEGDSDLTIIAGRSARASGQLVRISGRLLNERGQAVPSAAIQIWQADGQGHYNHPSDKSTEAADPNFQGYASIQSDRYGRYEFTTVRPGPYRDDGAGGMRAPHIHFDVTGRVNRLVTQMYFEGESLNDDDRVLAFALGGRERLIAKYRDRAGAGTLNLLEWDIVLRDG